jgi:hypothetical protein
MLQAPNGEKVFLLEPHLDTSPAWIPLRNAKRGAASHATVSEPIIALLMSTEQPLTSPLI